MAKKVHTLGDSTMANYDESATVTRGWGMYFGNFLTNGWTSVNYARGGRDSRGGYNELWQTAKKNVEPGDYVIITFAHNDEKNDGMDGVALYEYYKSIGDNAKAAAVDQRGTVPSTTYKEYLGKIVDEVLERGAIPIIASPVCRSYFTGNKIRRNGRHDLGDSYSILTDNGPSPGHKVAEGDHTMDYAWHAQQLAAEKGIAFIDLTSATATLYESYGDAKCHEYLFDGEGSTHFNATGALLVARECARLMKAQRTNVDKGTNTQWIRSHSRDGNSKHLSFRGASTLHRQDQLATITLCGLSSLHPGTNLLCATHTTRRWTHHWHYYCATGRQNIGDSRHCHRRLAGRRHRDTGILASGERCHL